MTSVYLKCDGIGCHQVIDKLPKEMDPNFGTTRDGSKIRAYAESVGWKSNNSLNLDYCPYHISDADE